MPLFEYRCADCEATLEVFQQPGDSDPRLCGHRCALGAGQDDELRGMGQLSRTLSAPAGSVRSEVFGDRPTDAELRRSGFTVYRNEGSGLRRSSGEGGPEWVPEDE